MPRSRKARTLKPELLPPAPIPTARPDLNALLTRAVEQKVAEVIAQQEGLIFQPWFQSKRVADAIRHLQTVTEQRKWTLYYASWGCLRCGTKKVTHETLGMCERCYQCIVRRLKDILRKHGMKNQDAPPFVTDLDKQARQALTATAPQPPECSGEMGFIDRVAQARHSLRKPRKALPAAVEVQK